MKLTTLCYIERDDQYLMLHRIKKKNDLNEGKWIGVGGHVEAGETPEECIRRETLEETGLTLKSCVLRGVVEFVSERWEDETMFLYTADAFTGELADCNEGVLEWVEKGRIFALPLWEGDMVFLNYLLEDEPFFHLEVRYDAEDRLISSRRLSSLILASASPRRQELIGLLGLTPVILPSLAEEKRTTEIPEALVEALAVQKAEDVAGQIFGERSGRAPAAFTGKEVVIGADTMVVCDGRILGKPGTHEEAAEMIRLLQGRTHRVYTGVALVCADGRRRSFVEGTEVRVAPMSEAEILLYAESEHPMDKAGAYGVQGPFAAFVEGLDGDYFNVMGLPVHRLYEALKEEGCL